MRIVHILQGKANPATINGVLMVAGFLIQFLRLTRAEAGTTKAN